MDIAVAGLNVISEMEPDVLREILSQCFEQPELLNMLSQTVGVSKEDIQSCMRQVLAQENFFPPSAENLSKMPEEYVNMMLSISKKLAELDVIDQIVGDLSAEQHEKIMSKVGESAGTDLASKKLLDVAAAARNPGEVIEALGVFMKEPNIDDIGQHMRNLRAAAAEEDPVDEREPWDEGL